LDDLAFGNRNEFTHNILFLQAKGIYFCGEYLVNYIF